MTNSEKQTKSAETSSSLPAYASADFWGMAITKRPALFFGGVLLLVGWGFSLHINSWHFTVPVLMLWFAWLGVLFTVRLLWSAGVAMASEAGAQSTEVLDVSESRRIELLEEKKSLIRAIKEIEFDRDLGKMSPEDATEIMRFYRSRAIEVIKELDGALDAQLSVEQRVARDLQARLAVQTAIATPKDKSLIETKDESLTQTKDERGKKKTSRSSDNEASSEASPATTDATADTPPSTESKDSDAPTKKRAASASEEPSEAPLDLESA